MNSNRYTYANYVAKSKKAKERLNIKGWKTREGESNIKFFTMNLMSEKIMDQTIEMTQFDLKYLFSS